MPVFQPNVRTAYEKGEQTVVTTTEKAVAQVEGLSSRGPDEKYALTASLDLSAGTATTKVNVRVRRGSGIAGTVIAETTAELLIGEVAKPATYSLAGTCALGELTGETFTLTVQQTAATGNGTVTNACLQVIQGSS